MNVDELTAEIAEVGGDRRRGRERRANQSRSLPVYFYAFDLDYIDQPIEGLLARHLAFLGVPSHQFGNSCRHTRIC
jgi:hypothetical protein